MRVAAIGIAAMALLVVTFYIVHTGTTAKLRDLRVACGPQVVLLCPGDPANPLPGGLSWDVRVLSSGQPLWSAESSAGTVRLAGFDTRLLPGAGGVGVELAEALQDQRRPVPGALHLSG